MQARHESTFKRAAKLARLVVHVFRGLWIVSLRFPRLDARGQDRELRRWSRKLLGILRVKVVAHNEPASLPARCLLVTNHVSWLDIFVVYALTPGIFVAKSEIRRWPVVGTLVARTGTLFIERGRRSHARQMNGHVRETLAGGRLVAVCPEGTTTDGRTLKPFHTALLQPAIDAGATLLPAGIRYADRRNELSDAAAYVGETSLLESVWRIAGERAIVAEVRFAPCIESEGYARRDLARAAESAIARELGLPPPHRPSGTRADPRAEPPSGGHPRRSPHPAPADQA
jgi:1-acyl-sn-glycerol-3-phosphate acyltransferase